MDLFDFNHDGEVSDLERIIGLAAVLSETNPDVEISVTVGEDEDYGRELVSFRGMDLSRRETIAEVSDWSIRFELSKKAAVCTCLKSTQSRLKTQVNHDACICGGAVPVMIWISYEQLTLENIKISQSACRQRPIF